MKHAVFGLGLSVVLGAALYWGNWYLGEYLESHEAQAYVTDYMLKSGRADFALVRSVNPRKRVYHFRYGTVDARPLDLTIAKRGKTWIIINEVNDLPGSIEDAVEQGLKFRASLGLPED